MRLCPIKCSGLLRQYRILAIFYLINVKVVHPPGGAHNLKRKLSALIISREVSIPKCAPSMQRTSCISLDTTRATSSVAAFTLMVAHCQLRPVGASAKLSQTWSTDFVCSRRDTMEFYIFVKLKIRHPYTQPRYFRISHCIA